MDRVRKAVELTGFYRAARARFLEFEDEWRAAVEALTGEEYEEYVLRLADERTMDRLGARGVESGANDYRARSLA